MKIKYLALVLLTGFASVKVAAQSASPVPTTAQDVVNKSADDIYTVVKEVPGSKPTWTVIYSGHPVFRIGDQNYPGSPMLRYTLQFDDKCYFKSPKEYDCDHPLAVGQILNHYHVAPYSGTMVQVDETLGTFSVIELDGGKQVSHFYKILRIDAIKDAAQSAAQSTPIKDCVDLAPGFTPMDGVTPCPDKAIKAKQTPPSRKDIPTIAKAANGAIVTIVMANNDKPIAQGTGFIVNPDGVIVTNYHVIATGNLAVVKFPDGSIMPVDGVLAADKTRDLAIIKIHDKTFRTLTLGNSDRIQVGEEVVAIGNPLGLELTVSNGILSGMRTDEKLGGKFLQTTAPISPGSSGGPLFNMQGEVVGINTLYLEGGENLNFAIPINDAKILLENQSAVLENLPNQIEPAAPSAAPAATPAAPPEPNTPSLETSVEFMKRMAEPEHHDILPGELSGAEFSTKCGASLTVVAYDKVYGGFVTGTSEKNGYPAYTYDIIGEYKQENYPRYTSFCLKDIDPTSIDSIEAGLDVSALSEFWNKHPECKSTQCMNEYLKSGAKLTAVRFHTTDLKPLIERGGFEGQSTCSNNEKTTGGVGCKMVPKHTETVVGAMIFFRDKSRAQRFVTALIYAVKSQGGQADMFPPTP